MDSMLQDPVMSHKLAYSMQKPIDLRSYSEFKKTFPLQGERLFTGLHHRHPRIIQTQKSRIAVANLKKIFTATFKMSAGSGFDRMSLRDLARATGMSMGAIYSCISKKEDIAVMVADVVGQSSALTHRHAQHIESLWPRIEQSIRFHLYASTLLQPWYFFLFFETRSLPEPQQTESKNIELDAIAGFRSHIEAGVAQGEFHCDDSATAANTIVVMLEDWYLKPWKYKRPQGQIKMTTERESELNHYYQTMMKLVNKLLR